MRKVLIITADKTGTGHKSSANAVEKKLRAMGYDVKQLNCFPLLGPIGVFMENCYIDLTTKYPYVWHFSYLLCSFYLPFVERALAEKVNKNFINEIKEYEPDLILSVHAMFNKSIYMTLKKNKLDIPFAVNVIDLVKPPRFWQNKKADLVFVPTVEVYHKYVKLGHKPENLIISGFPIREDIAKPVLPKSIKDGINVLMVNPSTNLNHNIEFLREIARIKGVSIDFVCGRDDRLYKAAVAEVAQNSNLSNVRVHGFIRTIPQLLESAHILLTKAGPNMILEGAKSGTAIVVTGHIPGQESYNYRYVIDYKIGIKCEDPYEIYDKVSKMIDSGDINKYLKNVLRAPSNNGAEIISNSIDEFLNK